MKILIVGSGKLANALLTADWSFQSHEIQRWETSYQNLHEKSIVVHAGSGRQFEECATFCSRTKSVLIELSTGLGSEKSDFDFPCLKCPNTSILVLKVLNMFRENGKQFENYDISILESHQSSKKAEAGTALAFARSLKVSVDNVVSVRDPEIQQNLIGIPEDYLSKHAYHKITIRDGDDVFILETKVLGHTSYVNGVKKLVKVVLENELEYRLYSIFDLMKNNLL
jgi:dihydrodipicolinate reductase